MQARALLRLIIVAEITSFIRDGKLLFSVKNPRTGIVLERSIKQMVQLARVVYILDGRIERCG